MSAEGEWVAIQHVPFEGPGAIATAANRAGHELRRVHPYRGEPLAAVDELAGLIIMGGPMSVNDAIAHPHLRDELELVEALLALGKPLLGDGHTLPVIHWHGETFELPHGSELLASTDRYRHQAFRYGEHTYALQFHVEVDAPLANEWVEHLPPGVEIAADARAGIEAVGEVVLDAFFAVAGA